MERKRVLVLGGNVIQADATIKAKELGYYVISADLHRDNPGHQYADEYRRLDISDREAVLNESERLGIDGIIPYSSDALSLVSAYVAERMGLPGNPYESVRIVTHKDLLRDFLRSNGFAAPWSASFSNVSEAVSCYSAMTAGASAAIMKPVDSSGSRGVFKISSPEDIRAYWDASMSYSGCGRIIVENFIEKVGRQLYVDAFISNGKIISACFFDQFDGGGKLAPVIMFYPSHHASELKNRIIHELKRLFSLLDISTGPCLAECIIGNDGEIYFIDIGFRNGGHGIPFLVKSATGFDEDLFTVKAAAGDESTEQMCILPQSDSGKFIMRYRPAPQYEGIYRGLWLSDYLKSRTVRIIPLKREGSSINLRHNGDDSVAVMFASFESRREMEEMAVEIENHVKAIVDQSVPSISSSVR